MDIDFEIKEVILKKEFRDNYNRNNIKVEIYSKSDIAINKKWNSLYFANNNSIFAFVEINKKKYYLRTIGEVSVKKELPLPEWSEGDVIEFIESFYEYDNDYFYNIQNLIDNNEDMIVEKTNTFAIVQSENIYEALCEKDRYIPYKDCPGTLRELINSMIDCIMKNESIFSNTIEVRAV